MRKIKRFLYKCYIFIKKMFSKENRFFNITLIASISVSVIILFVGSLSAFYAPVYRIENQDDFDLMREHPDAKFILTKQSIEITKSWIPIGSKDAPFTGELNGAIDGIRCSISFKLDSYSFIPDGNNEYFGLFGVNEGTIRNLQLYISDDLNISSNYDKNSYFGYISAINNGSISDCNVIFTKKTTIECNGNNYIGVFGGFGGNNYMRLSANNINMNIITSDVKNSSSVYFGGICGGHDKSCRFDQCKTGGSISMNAYNAIYLGGFVGRVDSDNGECYITNSITDAVFSNLVDSSERCLGGFVGNNEGMCFFNSCYSKLRANEYYSNIGGFVGENFNTLIMQNCLSNIYNQSNNVIDAFVNKGVGSFFNCYWIKNSSGVFSKFGNEAVLSNLTLEQLNWDANIWAKSTDFYLL